MFATLSRTFLPRESAATKQTLGHPASGVIGWVDSASNPSGVAVTPETALTYAALWCGVRIISETLATLPCILYRKTADGGRERATDDERYWLVHDEPHPEIAPINFYESMTAQLVLNGNCYARIVYDQEQRPSRLEPRIPSTVIPEVDGESLRYKIDILKEDLPAREMLHVLGLGGDGITGWSVVKYGAGSLGNAMAMDNYAGAVLGQGATPGGLLVHPMRLNKDARDALRKDWNEIHQGGSKAGKVGILHGGMDWKATGMNNQDAQLLQSRQYSVRDVARWLRLPPHMLGDLADSSVRANIEQQAIEFIVYAMAPWLKRWEQTLNRKLLSRDERKTMYFEFLLDSLLRGDIESRYRAYATARQWGWASVNDILAMENRNAIPNGDIYLQPSNMVPAGTESTPAAATNGFQQNLAESIATIIESAKTMRQSIEDHNGINAAMVDGINVSITQQLASLREDRELIRRDIEELGKTQRLAAVEFRDSLPRSTIGKIMKRELREPYWAGRTARI